MTIIGDVHGDPEPLRRLIDRIAVQERSIVFLGDLVNRGPDSKAVLSFVCDLIREGVSVTIIRGNHEEEFLRYYDRGGFASFAMAGGIPTIRSYVHSPVGDVWSLFRSQIMKEHVDLLRSSVAVAESKQLLSSHAGFIPGSLLPVGNGSWSRFSVNDVSRHRLGKLIVCGHYLQKSGEPFRSRDFVCLDTGCGMGGWLTALNFPEGTFLQASSTQIREF